MSLVSSVIGKISWYGRASDIEFEMLQVGEQLNASTKRASKLADAITNIDTRLNNLQMQSQSIWNMQNAMHTSIESGKANKDTGTWLQSIQKNLKALANAMKACLMQKQNLEVMKRVEDQKEKALQSKKLQLDTQKKLADAMGPAFEKMEDKAIQRFAPKV